MNIFDRENHKNCMPVIEKPLPVWNQGVIGCNSCCVSIVKDAKRDTGGGTEIRD
jgi:hypothetical protein